MVYQTLEERANEVFDSLGGCWILVNFKYGCNVYKKCSNGDVIYVFEHESIKGQGNKKFGILL